MLDYRQFNPCRENAKSDFLFPCVFQSLVGYSDVDPSAVFDEAGNSEISILLYRIFEA